VLKSRARLLVLPWPQEKDGELASLIEATLTRRGARLSPVSTVGDVREYSIGPDLKMLAYKRVSDFVWIAPSASELRVVPVVAWNAEIVRFSKLDLSAAREEGKRWGRIEGPRSPEHARPLADRVLGLLGWMPSVRSLEVERTVTGSAFKERVVFGFAPPRAATPPAPKPSPAAK
jgi:hypothetical protein